MKRMKRRKENLFKQAKMGGRMRQQAVMRVVITLVGATTENDVEDTSNHDLAIWLD